jgi:50S ribosomal protein L16 3-hydroxylase
LPGELPELSADELAWLATLDDVESRLIFTEQKDDATHYRVEHGPFEAKLLAALPPENWTLLVQDVEKHLPEFRKLLQVASFIPDWRIDDLMVSFAVPGGSAGPHRDNYDVFLCQGTGRREWRIAPANGALKTMASGGLSLLEPFADHSPITASCRDVLYLPSGVAHWGIATEACMTYSIGMRAPTLSQFAASLARIHDNASIEYEGNDNAFYSDPDLTADEAEPGLISARALDRARTCFGTDASLPDDDFAYAFGCVVTDVKAWLAPEAPIGAEIDAFLKSLTQGPEVRVHGMARLAFLTSGNHNLVFANGFGKTVSSAEYEVFRRLCANRAAHEDLVRSMLKGAGGDELFRWLVTKGAFDVPTEQPGDVT